MSGECSVCTCPAYSSLSSMGMSTRKPSLSSSLSITQERGAAGGGREAGLRPRDPASCPGSLAAPPPGSWTNLQGTRVHLRADGSPRCLGRRGCDATTAGCRALGLSRKSLSPTATPAQDILPDPAVHFPFVSVLGKPTLNRAHGHPPPRLSPCLGPHLPADPVHTGACGSPGVSGRSTAPPRGRCSSSEKLESWLGSKSSSAAMLSMSLLTAPPLPRFWGQSRIPDSLGHGKGDPGIPGHSGGPGRTTQVCGCSAQRSLPPGPWHRTWLSP